MVGSEQIHSMMFYCWDKDNKWLFFKAKNVDEWRMCVFWRSLQWPPCWSNMIQMKEFKLCECGRGFLHNTLFSKHTILEVFAKVELSIPVFYRTSSKVSEKQDIWIECDSMKLNFDNIHTQDNHQVCLLERTTWFKYFHMNETTESFGILLAILQASEFHNGLSGVWGKASCDMSCGVKTQTGVLQNGYCS